MHKLKQGRESTVTKVVGNMRAILGMLVGLVLVATGIRILNAEVDGDTYHKGHIYIAAATIGFGALLIVPALIAGSIRDIIIYVGPYIPIIGGRRASDPPKSPTDAP